MHEVLVNRLGGLSLPRKSVVRLTDRPDMTLDVYRGRKTTIQQQQQPSTVCLDRLHTFEVLLTEVTAVSPVIVCGVHVSPWTGIMGMNPLTLRADML